MRTSQKDFTYSNNPSSLYQSWEFSIVCYCLSRQRESIITLNVDQIDFYIISRYNLLKTDDNFAHANECSSRRSDRDQKLESEDSSNQKLSDDHRCLSQGYLNKRDKPNGRKTSKITTP